jgi:hypothetical protein
MVIGIKGDFCSRAVNIENVYKSFPKKKCG